MTALTLADRARLASAIEAVEAGLAETQRSLPPKKKAELVMAAYDLLAQETGQTLVAAADTQPSH